jgi:hypothetical protein
MNMVKNIVFRIVAGLVLLAAIAGIAFFAYQAGVTHGAAANIQLPVAEDGVVFYPHFGMHTFMGFGFFGVLFVLFLLCLAFGAMRRLFWGPRWGWRHMGHFGPEGQGPMGRGSWGERVPPFFSEWHKRAHASPSAEEQPADKKPGE